ncbi:hypothetical protein Acr_18g0012320 [Actinidia rufa]|uniref:Leucine-rich repeat-containing N-terminal plant-type domain-containing protein n=1 Tax=Actinidia rufa TaxID=165716 RepID=A0A7J0G8K6_9ERIC|nr:hypothetical protein Acr_18g0012320 [Actinidia rufa]
MEFWNVYLQQPSLPNENFGCLGKPSVPSLSVVDNQQKGWRVHHQKPPPPLKHGFLGDGEVDIQLPLCHEGESSALLQFKHSFFINEHASRDRFAYPKVESWKLEGNTSDCCSWDGVECDHNTGHVIGLNLSSSFLCGSIDANSSLLSLVHLRRLNLADNHFNYSRIPSGVRRLSRLTSLNLSRSSLIGSIPSEILDLSLLISLDLSKNFDQRNPRFWELQIPSPTNLVQNLTNLKELYLSGVYIPTTIPDILANMSSLTAIDLANCGLYGEFPRSIFQLPNLKILRAGFNQNLTGSLPEFQSSSSRLERSDLSGNLPSSLGNLTQLTVLELRVNKFSGQIPFSLANLSQLTTLALGRNYFDEGMRLSHLVSYPNSRHCTSRV